LPRRTRTDLPGFPFHVTQRGVNRCDIFVDDDDRQTFLRLLRWACKRYLVEVHAYVLMGNHIHLLMTPRQERSMSKAMQLAGQNYVQRFNVRHGRTGPLWQGRFKSCLVETDRYFLNVARYIERNPVRAGLCDSANRYRWSSVHAHLNGVSDGLVTFHPCYLSLGSSPSRRRTTYLDWLSQDVSRDETKAIRKHIDEEKILGSDSFCSSIKSTREGRE
jgi:putative transposase